MLPSVCRACTSRTSEGTSEGVCLWGEEGYWSVVLGCAQIGRRAAVRL